MMGGRKFFVTVGAVFLLTLTSLPAYAGTYLGEVLDVNLNEFASNEYGITEGTDVRLDYNTVSHTFDVFFGDPSSPLAHFDEEDVSGDLIMFSDLNDQLTELGFTTDNYNKDEGLWGHLVIDAVPDDPHSPAEPLDSIAFSLQGGWLITGTVDYAEVPIPGAIFLLGSGLACLLGLRRRFIKA